MAKLLDRCYLDQPKDMLEKYTSPKGWKFQDCSKTRITALKVDKGSWNLEKSSDPRSDYVDAVALKDAGSWMVSEKRGNKPINTYAVQGSDFNKMVQHVGCRVSSFEPYKKGSKPITEEESEKLFDDCIRAPMGLTSKKDAAALKKRMAIEKMKGVGGAFGSFLDWIDENFTNVR